MRSPAVLQLLPLHATEARIGRLSSSAAALDLDLHVSTGPQQQHQLCCPKLREQHQHQQPPSPLRPAEARLGRIAIALPSRRAIRCKARVSEALVPELRSRFRPRRPCRLSRRELEALQSQIQQSHHHGPRLSLGTLIQISFPPPPLPIQHHRIASHRTARHQLGLQCCPHSMPTTREKGPSRRRMAVNR